MVYFHECFGFSISAIQILSCFLIVILLILVGGYISSSTHLCLWQILIKLSKKIFLAVYYVQNNIIRVVYFQILLTSCLLQVAGMLKTLTTNDVSQKKKKKVTLFVKYTRRKGTADDCFKCYKVINIYNWLKIMFKD